MKVEDVMRENYSCVSLNDSLRSVWKQMKEKECYMMVIKEDGEVKGATDMWNLLLGVAKGRFDVLKVEDIYDFKSQEHFGDNLIVVLKGQPLSEVAKKMKNVNLLAIPVYCEEESKVIGVVTAQDILNSQ